MNTNRTDKSLRQFEINNDGEARDASLPYMRPRDAATLIILDHKQKKPKVLMGKRSAQHRFMPNKFVFPGGRVDPCDSRLKVSDSLRAPVMKNLQYQNKQKMTETRLRALALAAIRETYEETGLILGRKTNKPIATRHPVWQSFIADGVEPALKNLDFVTRAITPPQRTRRFDTRFFLADAADLYNDPADISDRSGELLELHWLGFNEAKKLDLPTITRQVLAFIEDRLQHPLPERYARPVPFFRAANGKFLLTNLKGGE